ncbi:MAG TPA: hypothetical protein GX505_02395 [Clostridiales bacterium]|nr:hypothetical protein [Clostridiales bacterium]
MLINEYYATLNSSQITGEVKLVITEDALDITALFDGIVVSYSEITSIELYNYMVQIKTDDDIYTISRLRNGADPFFHTLYTAYNNKVRKALFITDKPVFTTSGEYRFTENGKTTSGSAVIEIYNDCVLILPPNDNARRIPLCFTADIQTGDYALTLVLDTGESYSFNRLGYDMKPFVDSLSQQLRNMRARALDAVRAIDSSLTSAQASAIARMMPEGAAVPLHLLAATAPSFAAAVEERIKQSRVAEEYLFLREICEPRDICVGMKSHLAGDVNENVIWLIAPGRTPGVAAVEFATGEETAAATFIYRFTESWDIFQKKLNRAMEAVNFKREVIRLKDDELTRPEYSDYAMAVKRTPALRFLRKCFAGRVIHASEESWKREITSHLQ